MYIETVPNRKSPPAVLLRESWREDGKVKKRTLANLSKMAPDVVEGLKVLLKGGVAFANPHEVLRIERALPHGHVSAVLGTLRDVGLERMLGGGGKSDAAETRLKDLALAMIVGRVIAPGSKLSTLRALSDETAGSSLGRVLGLVREIQISDRFRLIELEVPSSYVGKTLEELGLPARHGVQVLLVRRRPDPAEAPDPIVPRADLVLHAGDRILLGGAPEAVAPFRSP